MNNIVWLFEVQIPFLSCIKFKLQYAYHGTFGAFVSLSIHVKVESYWELSTFQSFKHHNPLIYYWLTVMSFQCFLLGI